MAGPEDPANVLEQWIHDGNATAAWQASNM